MQARKITYIIAAVIAAILISSIIGGGARFARAAVTTSTTSATPVLDDLQKDENFNAEDYPRVPKDYSLQVIQIAESTDGELLIYVYQPSGSEQNLYASTINIAREPNDDKNLTFKNYSLERVSLNGVFFKYKVLDFKISTTAERYYNISNILRPFNDKLDEPPADGYISEVPNRVAQLWTVETVGDSVTYTMETSEVITITQKVVGYCVYDDGLKLGWGTMEGITKAYFVAFDTDRPIDKLISADLTFFATRAHCKVCCNDKHDHGYLYDFHDPEYIDYGTGVYNNEPLTVTDKQSFGNQGGGNVRPATKLLHKRIRSTSEFIADNNNKDYALEAGDSLNGTKWVLNFYEAQDRYKLDNVWVSFIPLVTNIKGVADGEAELNNVYDVQILRLEFETDGVTYNLGVVDNKQTGGTKPFNSIKDNGRDLFDWLADKLNVPKWAAKVIFYGVIALIVCGIFMPILAVIFPVFRVILKAILTGIITVIKYLLIGLWWLVSLPFRLIAKAVNNRKDKPKSGGAQ